MVLTEFLSRQPAEPTAPRLVDGGIVMAAVAALALGSATEFALIAELPKDVPRPALPDFARFGWAVDAETGEILSPGSALPGDRHLYASLRITIPAAEGEALQDVRQEVLGTLARVAANGWAIEVGARLTAADDRSLPAIHAQPDQLAPLPVEAGGQVPDGAHVLLGVVDFGCDFAHPAFRLPDGHTRLRFLWDQNAATPPGAAVPGKVHKRADIDTALAAMGGPEAAFDALGYHPDENLYIAIGTPDDAPVHGTHVLGVAAGRAVPAPAGRPDPGCPAGVAPGAELAFVHLRPGALISDGDPADVLDGVCAIFAEADAAGIPAVVNLSLGANFGPHDGSTLLDCALDALLERPKRAIVVAAGNGRNACCHAGGTLDPGGKRSLAWRFVAGDATANTLRVFYKAPGGQPLLDCTVTDPEGSAVLSLPGPGQVNTRLLVRDGSILGVLYAGLAPGIGEAPLQQIELRLTPSVAEDETWQVALHLPPGAAGPLRWDAWIQRDDRARSASSEDRAVRTASFFVPEDAEAARTLSAIACGHRTVSVGAFNGAAPGWPPMDFTAAGRTLDDREKPDVAAPGGTVFAARALGGRVFGLYRPLAGPMQGTSVAAPHVAGVVALMLQARPGLRAEEIGAALRETTQVPAGGARAYDARLGFGPVDAAAAVAKVLA